MPDWLSYRPEDFLLFSARTYWRLFELHNAALWPLQLVALLAGMVVLVLALRSGEGRWMALVLAAFWALAGWSFVWTRYAGINWAMAYLAPAFAVQAVLLVALGTGLAVERRGPAAWIGGLLAAFALAGYPLLAPLLGRAWASAEIMGIAPDPTAIGTLGFLLLVRGWVGVLAPIPLLWCLQSAATLGTMGAAEAWVPGVAVVLFLVGGVVRLVRGSRAWPRSPADARPTG